MFVFVCLFAEGACVCFQSLVWPCFFYVLATFGLYMLDSVLLSRWEGMGGRQGCRAAFSLGCLCVLGHLGLTSAL